MKSVIFGVQPESLKQLMEASQKRNPDRQTNLVPFVDVVTKSPAKSGKYKGYHQIKITAIIPEDAIVGESCITDFGGFIVLDLEKKRVAEHLKKHEVSE